METPSGEMMLELRYPVHPLFDWHKAAHLPMLELARFFITQCSSLCQVLTVMLQHEFILLQAHNPNLGTGIHGFTYPCSPWPPPQHPLAHYLCFVFNQPWKHTFSCLAEEQSLA